MTERRLPASLTHCPTRGDEGRLRESAVKSTRAPHQIRMRGSGRAIAVVGYLWLSALCGCGAGPQGASTGGHAGTAATGGGSGGAVSVDGGPSQARIIDTYEQLVDVQPPRFGWVVNDSARGEAQTAYQIIVAADEATITANEGMLWDSGKVASAQQYGVTYAGPALAKTTKYWWKVRTWNKEGHASPWSGANSFVTGFFQPTDWDHGAQWIRHPQSTSAANDAPATFRKSFMVTKPVKQAFLYVTGLGQFVASLNGKKVGNHEIDPAWTDYDKLVNYVTFDVTAVDRHGCERPRRHARKRLVERHGLERRPSVRGHAHARPTARRLQRRDVDGGCERPDLEGDRQAHHLDGAPRRSRAYDARKLPDGWNTGTFDDSAWVAAAAATAP